MTEILLVMILALMAFSLFKKKPIFLGKMQKFTSQDDITTIPPVPLGAATCSHKWDVLTEQKLEMEHEKKCVIILQCHMCGLIDKTVQVTSPTTPQPCKHDWQCQIQQSLEMPHEKRLVVVMTCRNCGVLDKTTEVTSTSPKTKAECRHTWEAEKRVVLDSAYEQMLKSISTKAAYGKSKVEPDKRIDLDLNNSPSWMFKKTYICVRICKTCGEINETMASNFEEEDEPVEE